MKCYWVRDYKKKSLCVLTLTFGETETATAVRVRACVVQQTALARRGAVAHVCECEALQQPPSPRWLPGRAARY